jgi:thiamine pyrophosphate-dependent acetolactate synthase large subunit-like protein
MLEVRHEGVGLGMADGWARATHQTGVCTATCGPGVTQLATALVTAARAESPIVAFVGEYPNTDQDYGQRLDQARFAAACESGFVRIATPEGTDAAVRKAFYMARMESRPVLLSAPMDTQQKPFPDDEPYKPSATMLPTRVLYPNPEAIEEAARIVAESKKTVIVAGRGALWSGAGDAILKLAKRTGALLATSLQAKSWLAGADEYHVGVSGLYATRTAIQLFEEAECVIGIGASLNRHTTEGGYLYQNARYVQIDTKPHVVLGNGQSADCYVQSDARMGVEALEAALARKSFTSTGFRTREVKEKLVNHFADPREYPIEPGRIDPREICRMLDQLVPQEVSLIMGSGASTAFTNMLFNRPRPLMVGGHYFGCIGQMFPAAMGAVMATGKKPALLLDGDASFLMHLNDFDTAVRENMPLLSVILNDEALGSEYHKLKAHGLNAELATIPSPDIGAVAKAYGGRGVIAHSLEEVRAAAAEWVAKPGPMVIDARISRNVVSVPYRRVHFGEDA